MKNQVRISFKHLINMNRRVSFQQGQNLISITPAGWASDLTKTPTLNLLIKFVGAWFSVFGLGKRDSRVRFLMPKCFSDLWMIKDGANQLWSTWLWESDSEF